MPGLKIADLRSSVFWLRINQCDRDHCGKPMRDAACVEEVETYLGLVLVFKVLRLMPWIYGRAIGSGLLLVRDMSNNVVKCPVRCGRAHIELAHGIANAVARIRGAIGIAGIG